MFDPIAGKIVETGAGLGGDGQTAVDLTDGQYYAAANKNPGGPVLKVVDVRTPPAAPDDQDLGRVAFGRRQQ